MTIEQILKLGEMGFSKDDIIRLNNGDDSVENKKEVPEQVKEEPVKEEPKKEEPKREEPEKEKPEMFDSINATLNELIKTIQASNIVNSNNKTEERQAPENLLANIIAPPEKKGR